MIAVCGSVVCLVQKSDLAGLTVDELLLFSDCITHTK